LIACDRRALAALAALSLAGCSPSRDSTKTVVEVTRTWAVPAADVGVWCADVGDVRACWGADGRPTLVPRTLPPRPAPNVLGFRCTGEGPSRACAARDDVGEFVCEDRPGRDGKGAFCQQKHPRQPDDGQWMCSDDSGVTVCGGGAPAAGVPRSRVASGWECGEARARPLPGQASGRVCVDPSPDYPDGSPHHWRCRWNNNGARVRVCIRDADAHLVADACDSKSPCVMGAYCVGGRCLPPGLASACTLDRECGAAKCRFGSCLEGVP
jgi:hypothetical protein